MGGGGAEVSARERPGEQRSAAPQAGAPAVSLAGVAGAGAEAGGPGPIWVWSAGRLGWTSRLEWATFVPCYPSSSRRSGSGGRSASCRRV